MGSDNIPSFEDKRRSLFIDLTPLAVVAGVADGRLEVKHRVEEKKSRFSAYWISNGVQTFDLTVCGWTTFRRVAGNFLLEDA